MRYNQTILYKSVSPGMEPDINKILNKNKRDLTQDDKIALMRHIKFMDVSGLDNKDLRKQIIEKFE